MNRSVGLLFALGTALLAACGTLVFEADFDDWPAGSPAGPPPGPPADDQIVVLDSENPVVGRSKLVIHPEGTTWFYSHPVRDPDATRTIFWIGRLSSGDGPFTVQLAGANTPGDAFPIAPLSVQLSNSDVKILDPHDAVLHSHGLNPNGEHEVFVSLRPESGTYRITVQQPGADEIEFTGSLDPTTLNSIQSQPRIVLYAGFLADDTPSEEYQMDDVIMRKK